MNSVSLILLHSNKAAYSRACLNSLLHLTQRPLQIINVDNGSRDETAQVLDEWEVLAHENAIETQRLNFATNIGAIEGRNEAMKCATGDYWAFLDNDTLCAQTDWLQRLVSFLNEPGREKCGIVAPKMLFPWQPHHIECAGCGVSQSGRIQYIGRGDERETFSEPFGVQCLISAAWLMRREVVEQIGMLDAVYSPVQYEDLDFCYRARQAGWSCWVQPQAEVMHFEHTTTAGSGDINFGYVTAKNGITFKKRWREMFASENGPTDAQTAWRDLPKCPIEEVDLNEVVAR